MTNQTLPRPKFLKVLIAIILISGLALPASVSMAAVPDPGFNPSLLIDDKVFTDIKTFGGPQGIQQFLEKQNSVLANKSEDFLIKLREPGFTDLKQKLDDPNPSLGRLRTAAELIWDASQMSGLNPQVFIVKLQKEQGLITNRQTDAPDKLQRALDFALGFGCPDNSPCNGIFQGFYFQMFGGVDASGDRYLGAGKSLVKAFNIPIGQPVISLGGKIGKVGDVIELTNTTDPYGVPSTQQVMLTNRATAALYRYTPHVYNGNYNFWKYFNQWFKYPNGTVMQVGSDATKYIIQNGSRLLLPSFVAQAKGINMAQSIAVSPTEIESYPAEKNPLGPDDNTIVNVAGDTQKYVFINNVKHPASDFVIKQRKLDPAKTLTISMEESALFQPGPQLTPSEGTVLRGTQDKTVYKVQNGQLKAFSGFVFAQSKIKAAQVSIVPDAEIASYPKAGFVAPLDGTIIKAQSGDQAVYEIVGGKKAPFSAELFRNRKLTPKSLTLLSADEVAGLETSGVPLPKDKTFYKVSETGEQFYFTNGVARPLVPFVIKQQKITPDYTFSQSEHNSWKIGTAAPPREGTIVKGDNSSAVYVVSGRKLRPLTFDAFKRRKITTKQISILPQSDVDKFEVGDVLTR